MATEIDNGIIEQFIQHHIESDVKVLSIIIPNINKIFWQAHGNSLGHDQNVIQNPEVPPEPTHLHPWPGRFVQ